MVFNHQNCGCQKILAVDDNAFNLNVINNYLKNNFNVVCCLSGDEAI